MIDYTSSGSERLNGNQPCQFNILHNLNCKMTSSLGWCLNSFENQLMYRL